MLNEERIDVPRDEDLSLRKADLIAGQKKVKNVWNINPFENSIVKTQLSRQEINIEMKTGCINSFSRELHNNLHNQDRPGAIEMQGVKR